MSIQTRLTFSFTALFGLIVLGLAIGSYLLVRNSLFSDLNTELQVAVDGTAMSAEHELNEHQNAASGEADLQDVLNQRRDVVLPDTQILVRQGNRQAAYKAGAHATIDLRTIPSIRLREKTFANLRIASRELPVAKFHSQYRIYAATPTTVVDHKLNRFALVLTLLVPFGLVLAASAGYVLAKKSLAPLYDLSSTIEAVTSADLSVRVTVAGNNDEISRIGRQFNSLLDRLQHAFDCQQRFMADASHELRTPVTVALAAAQVTTRDAFHTQTDSDDALRVVEAQMLRVRKIVQELLLLSQADASSLKVRNEDLYFDDIVAEVSRAAQALARVKQQQLEVQPLPEARIKGDSELLGQAIMILLDNAVKFTPPGGHVDVRIGRSGAYWVCQITDSGIGIPKNEQPNVFDRFYRVVRDAAAGREFGGSGLGLAIAKAIVDSHRGTLTLAESKPGFTRFEIGLLAMDDEENQPAEQNPPNSFAVKI
ncbi:MAG TPA: ATP-binding protein [Bryobacteraceae bacterium]|nr:ATP-binding protein [Bryobacteraceae bacterium]